MSQIIAQNFHLIYSVQNLIKVKPIMTLKYSTYYSTFNKCFLSVVERVN